MSNKVLPEVRAWPSSGGAQYAAEHSGKSEFEASPPPRYNSFDIKDDETKVHWFKRNRGWVIFGVAVLMAAIGAGASAAYVFSKSAASSSPMMNSTLQQIIDMIGSSKLLVSFQNKSTQIESLIPPLLMQFISTSQLDLSNIHVLDCIDEEILQQAVQYLSDAPGGLEFISRDYSMNQFPSVTHDLLGSIDPSQASDISSILAQIQAGTGIDLTSTVNDPFYVNGSQWYLDMVNATNGWQLLTGSSDVVVAIIDTGVDLTHPDLAGSLWINKGEIPGNGIDDDGNGYIDDVHGYDFAGNCSSFDQTGVCSKCGGQPNALPSLYHGTHAAGIVAATQNNGIGVTGVTTGVKLMVLKVSDCLTGAITASAVFEAFNYAAKMGAHVASCSFGSSYPYGFAPTVAAPSYQSQYTQSYKTAIQPLADKGILVVAAAGNEAIDLDLLNKMGYSYSPCLVPLPNILCVGATDFNNNKAYFSNYGTQSVHVGSPGEEIYSTFYINSSDGALQHTYAPLNGSSMSTPIVSGSAAMALSLLGGADGNYYRASLVKSLIINASTMIPGVPPPSQLPWQSRGLLNIGTLMTRTLASLSVAQSFSPHYLVWPSASFIYNGFQTTYYNTSSAQVIDAGAKTLRLDPSQTISFTSFKYTGPSIRVSYSALIQATSQGLWGVRLSGNSSGASAVLVNGLELTMSNNTALFLASSIGWYQIEIRIIIPKASGGFQLLVRPPSSPVFITYNGFVTAGPALASGSNTSLNSPRDLLSSWDVFYNVVNVTSSPLKLTSIYNASSAFQYTLRGINPFTSSLGSSLLPVGSSMVVLGSMNSLFQPSAANATASFSITCPGCQVLLDGLVVIDSFISLISSAPPAASRSPCLGMTTDQHQLTIRFAVAFNSSMSFSLIPC